MTGSKRKGIVIQPRDLRLFKGLSILTIADREQASVVAGFASITRSNARLLILTRAGLLERTFIGTIGSGHKALYSLTPKSAALVQARLPVRRLRASDKQIGSPFLVHQLTINQIYLTVKHRPIPVAGVNFRRWLAFREPLSTTLPLIPDGYCELEVGGTVRPMFVEVDLGTEDHTIWQKKVQLYLQLALSGQFERWFGQPQFGVIVITTTGRRLSGIREAARKLTEKIFWFSTFETIQRDGFWSSIWLRPVGDQRHSLV